MNAVRTVNHFNIRYGFLQHDRVTKLWTKEWESHQKHGRRFRKASRFKVSKSFNLFSPPIHNFHLNFNPIYFFFIIYSYEYFSSSDLSQRYPRSLSQSATKDLIGCIDHDAGLVFADKALLALWVSYTYFVSWNYIGWDDEWAFLRVRIIHVYCRKWSEVSIDVLSWNLLRYKRLYQEPKGNWSTVMKQKIFVC